MRIKNISKVAMAIVFAVGCQVGLAQSAFVITASAGSEPIAHGGGCRKDSPPGKCCHAGSQPFHCH